MHSGRSRHENRLHAYGFTMKDNIVNLYDASIWVVAKLLVNKMKAWLRSPFLNALCPSGGDEMLRVRLQAAVRRGQQPHQPHHRERGHHLRPQPPQNLVAVGER